MPRADRSPLARSLDRLLAIVALTVLGVGLLELAVLISEGAGPLWILLTFVAVGWVYAAAGLIAWHQRPSNGLGAILVAGGLAMLAANLANIDITATYVVGTIVATLPLGVVVHLVLAFPSGRLASRASRLTVVAGYLTSSVLQAPLYLFATAPRPFGILTPYPDRTFFRVGQWVQDTVGCALIIGATIILVRRLRANPPLRRRVLAPLFAYGVIAVLLVPTLADGIGPLLNIPQVTVGAMQLVELAGIPVAFALVLLRGGFARAGEVEELGVLLGSTGGPRPVLGDALGHALGDPSLRLAFWMSEQGQYIDADGVEMTLPNDRPSVEVVVDGRQVGSIVYDGALIADAELVRTAGRVVAIALDRERLLAELLAGEEALRRSRERIVQAGDDERRAIARNLHDGLQVRLVVLALEAQELAADQRDPALQAAATALRTGIDAAAAELRDLVHAVMPAALVERGLSAAAEDLVDRIPLPTHVEISDIRRPLTRAAQGTAYFVMAEGLANALKHSRASELVVRLGEVGDHLVVEVCDDGVGGARLTGSGLRGLTDRVDALGGRLQIFSPTGYGTRLIAEIPCGS